MKTEMKICSKCREEKPKKKFHKNKYNKDGFAHYCKKCIRVVRNNHYKNNKERVLRVTKLYHKNNQEKLKKARKRYKKENIANVRAQSSFRRAKKRNASPSWADQAKIKHVYWVANFLSEVTGIKHHVDHIHPLINDKICGLHVAENLQILTEEENLTKSNKFPYYDEDKKNFE